MTEEQTRLTFRNATTEAAERQATALERIAESLDTIAALLAAPAALRGTGFQPRAKVAAWMTANGFATGHGDTLEMLLTELTWQVAELRGAPATKQAAADLESALHEYVKSGFTGLAWAKVSARRSALREALTVPPQADIDATETEVPSSAIFDDWIEWPGGKCPVPDGTLVDVRFRDGAEHQKQSAWGDEPPKEGAKNATYAGWAFWRHDGLGCDITHYRIAK